MAFNGVKINKVKLTNNLPKFVSEVERKAARSVLQSLILGGSEASVLTPIATGNLINSRYNQVSKDGTKIVGSTGYTADYAIPVNDPDVKQTFRRATARKEFLKKGFEKAEPNIRAVIKGAIRT